MGHAVRVAVVDARPTAVVPTVTTWSRLPTVWPELSGEVWACLRAGGITSGCPNVMLYRDDVPHLEVGVQLVQPCLLTGRVVASELPGGRVATTVHHGPYRGLDAAHSAVLDWCASHGERPSRTRWEIYGPQDEDVSRVWTEVCWLLT
jgi:effector-binding domain-containing protein